ncbi:hypothetical protein K469DRAFT_552163, partial [Zopfia rhizophila CBS 207.26]
LGTLYALQGKLNIAAGMNELARKSSEKELELDHQSTLDVVNNLPNLYVEQGKIDEAIPLY